MSDRRQALGRGLGALIPTETASVQRPVDVFFQERAVAAAGDEEHQSPSSGHQEYAQSPDHHPNDAAARATQPAHVGPSQADGAASATDELPPLVMTRINAGAETSYAAVEEYDHGLDHWSSGSRDAVGFLQEHARALPPEDNPDQLRPVPGAWFAEISVDAIRPNLRQPRTVFDPDEMAELAYSVREVGVLQPVVVRPIGNDGLDQPIGDQASYELVMGERRWRAAIAADLQFVPAIVKETHDDVMLRDALLENLHRTQLNPLEEAAAYQQLLDDFGCSKEELSARIGRSRPQVSNTLRLLKLPPLVQRRVAAGVLSAGHARALLPLEDGLAMERLAQRIVAEGLSVRSVEEIVSVGQGERSERPARPRTAVRRLDEVAMRLSDRFDTRVQVSMGRRKGRMVIEFAGIEDLERILALLD